MLTSQLSTALAGFSPDGAAAPAPSAPAAARVIVQAAKFMHGESLRDLSKATFKSLAASFNLEAPAEDITRPVLELFKAYIDQLASELAPDAFRLTLHGAAQALTGVPASAAQAQALQVYTAGWKTSLPAAHFGIVQGLMRGMGHTES
ncbi:MAG TPA: hypothetical protein VLJ86_14900 [Ramlibacter sp.]|nr:hypothetical protein [Ramlibacter sp.]